MAASPAHMLNVSVFDDAKRAVQAENTDEIVRTIREMKRLHMGAEIRAIHDLCKSVRNGVVWAAYNEGVSDEPLTDKELAERIGRLNPKARQWLKDFQDAVATRKFDEIRDKIVVAIRAHDVPNAAIELAHRICEKCGDTGVLQAFQTAVESQNTASSAEKIQYVREFDRARLDRDYAKLKELARYARATFDVATVNRSVEVLIQAGDEHATAAFLSEDTRSPDSAASSFAREARSTQQPIVDAATTVPKLVEFRDEVAVSSNDLNPRTLASLPPPSLPPAVRRDPSSAADTFNCVSETMFVNTSRRPLGAGASGTVHKVTLAPGCVMPPYIPPGQESRLVVKTFHDVRPKNEFQTAQREILGATLIHENIIRVYALVTAEGSPEEVVGVLMEEGVKARPADMPTLKVALDIAEGLRFAHQNRVIHGDVKIANVVYGMNDRIGTAKLTDFGSAKQTATLVSHRSTKSGKGTILFMAPEVLNGERATRASDVYSFAMTLYELFNPTGLDTKSVGGIVLERQKGDRPKIDPKVPADIRRLIESLWVTEPALRPSMDAVVEELRNLWDKAQSPSAPMKVRRRIGRLHDLWQLPACENEFVNQIKHLESLPLQLNENVWFSDPIRGNPFLLRHAGMETVSHAMLLYHERMPHWHMTRYAEQQSRFKNPHLRPPDNFDDVQRMGLDKLRSTFLGEEGEFARITLAWHATTTANVVRVANDLPRCFRVTDGGYFGKGTYFALEPAYAAQFPAPDQDGQIALMLFAINVSRVYVVCPDKDYPFSDDPQLDGFSRFYSPPGQPPKAVWENYSGHFIPVKQYGTKHPLDPKRKTVDIHYQACDTRTAVAHELVIESHLNCIPLAVFYVSQPSQAPSSPKNDRCASSV